MVSSKPSSSGSRKGVERASAFSLARLGGLVGLVGLVGFVGAASCIALIDKNADQCAVDGDCSAKGGAFAGRVCVQGVCVASSAQNDASTDSAIAVDSDHDALDGAQDTGDAGVDVEASGDATHALAGLFVVAGTVATGGVLVAIDPDTGAELKREAMSVSAIVYDPGLVTGGGDVWYIFEDSTDTLDGGIPTSKLRARSFDAASKSWTELGVALDVPRPKSPRDVLVMNKRLVYMASYVGPDPLGVGLVYLVDISAPTAPKLVCDGCLPGPANVVSKGAATDNYLGLLAGGRATDTLTGGTLGVGFVQACTDSGGTCPTFFQRFRYTGNDGHDIPGNQVSFGSFGSDVSVGIGTSAEHKSAFMVVPTTATSGALLQNAQTFFGAASPVATFDYSGRATFSPIAIDGCDDVALFTTFSNNLHAVPFGSKGLVATSIEGESASQTAFDTFSRVVAYIANGLRAARVSTTPGLSLTALPWPAEDYLPTAIAGRAPLTGCSK